MNIVHAPNEVLRGKNNPVDLKDPKLEKVIEEMKKLLFSQKDPEGVGLAANQVGLPLRLFLARFSSKKKEPVRVFINPEVVDHSPELAKEDKKAPLEGCLSLPNYYGIVKRWQWVKVKYQTTDHSLPSTAVVSSQWSVDRFEGFAATVVQHELDHLEGQIFVERILEQKGSLYRVTGKDKNGKEIWEEVEI